jgi:hypothetical protein
LKYVDQDQWFTTGASKKFKYPNSSILLLLKCDLNLISSLHIIHFTVMMYRNQFRAVKCFLHKIAMMGNVTGVPQNKEYVFRVPSVKKVENQWCRRRYTMSQEWSSPIIFLKLLQYETNRSIMIYEK